MHRACGVTPVDEVGWLLAGTLIFLPLRIESSTEGMEGRGAQPGTRRSGGSCCESFSVSLFVSL